MLKVYVPQLQRINPSLFEGLFYKIWPQYFNERLKDPRWSTVQGEFFYTAQTACTNVFTHLISEVIDAINTNRNFDLRDIIIDLSAIFDNYDCDDAVFEHFSSEDVWEAVYQWLEYYVNFLLSPNMLENYNKALFPIYNDLMNVKRTKNLVGFWYSTYDAECKLWEKEMIAYGIERDDYDELYRCYWPFNHYEKGCQGDPYLWSFYFCNQTGVIYLEDTGVRIPNGADVTYCQLRKDRADVIYKDY
ncbi:hypothetical protein ABFB94_11115 [Escherichia coli]|uniref:hypothetical protein n=2 Tax=Enterobacteriaceae TaxID=543 RepID=UPI0032113E7C